MRKISQGLWKKVAKSLLGRQVVATHFPLFHRLFLYFYSRFQPEGIETVKIPFDLKLNVFKKDPGVGAFLRLKGEYEPKTTEIFLRWVRKGDVVVDVGANIGYFTLLAAKKVGKKGRIFAFEPEPQSYSLLKSNITLNSLQNVVAENFALGDRNTLVGFFAQKFDKGGSHLAFSEGENLKVKMVRLSDYLHQKGVKKVNVIKIDVEGAEVLVLKGAEEIIKESPNLKAFVEYNPENLEKFKTSGEKLLGQLKDLELRIDLIIDEARGTVYPFSYAKLRFLMAKRAYVNLLAV